MGNNLFTGLRVLFVPDAFCSEASGARVVRFMAQCIVKNGGKVGVFCSYDGELPSDCLDIDIKLFERPKSKTDFLQHFIPTKQVKAYRSVLKSFQPHVVHFARAGIGKSYYFYKMARKKKIRIVSQFWQYDFYCARVFDCINNKPCGRCASGNFMNALQHGCMHGKTAILQLMSRIRLKKAILMSDVYLSTCDYLDDRLLEYGANRSSIIRYILPFDRQRVAMPSSDKGYFVFYGQCIREKGVGLLHDIARKCSDTKFIFLFSGGDKQYFEEFGLNNLGNNVEVYTDKRWDSGVADIVADARGVLLPSIWPTVTETVLLEAIGLRKPVIAFDVGIHRELFEHAKNALVYSAGDLDGFCDGIRLVNTDLYCREKLSNGSRKLFDRLTAPGKLESMLKAAYYA